MDKVIDDYIDLGRKEGMEFGMKQGMKQGMDRGRKDVIRSLCKKKSPEEVADLLDLPVEEVLEIIKE